MATFIDDTDGIEEVENTEQFTDLPEESPVEAVIDEPEEVEVEEELPEKYRGKSAKELAEMHSNLESLMGKQSSEVGELRRAVDALVQQQIQTQAQPAPEEIDDSDFFSNPADAVRKLIAQDPALQSARTAAAEMSKAQAEAQLKANHPDLATVVTSDDFKNWIAASKVRTAMFHKANEGYDYDQANELLTLYKERQGVVKQTQAIEKQAQKQELKKASTGSNRSTPAGKTPKKIYRRRDIIDLMQKDPKRYEALQDEIMAAYRENRVK